jgi:outer membrane protein
MIPITLLLTALFTTLAFADPADAAAENVLPLSMKRAIQIALAPEGSPRIALAQESINLAQEQIKDARAALLPDIESSVVEHRQTSNLKAFGFNFAFPVIPGVPAFSLPDIVGPFSVFDARATATQSIFDLAAIKRYQASKVNVDSLKWDFDAAKNQVAEQVARAYVAALRAGAALETAQANIDLSNALLKLAQTQKQAGTGTGIEEVRAQVQLANDRQRLAVAENDRRKAGLNLMRTMGLKLESTIQLTDKLEYAPVDLGTMDEALVAARKSRAELKAQHNREQYAQMTYVATRAERLPSVGASADYGAIGLTPANALGTYSYGVSVKVPIFNGGRREARAAEASVQHRQEEIRSHDLEQQVELEVRLAFDSISSAATQVTTAREGVDLSERELEQARRRYSAGVTNSIEVTDAQTRLDRARDNLIAALYNYNVARIDLATATGKIQEYVNQ